MGEGINTHAVTASNVDQDLSDVLHDLPQVLSSANASADMLGVPALPSGMFDHWYIVCHAERVMRLKVKASGRLLWIGKVHDVVPRNSASMMPPHS